VTLELREFLREYLSSGKPVVTQNATSALPHVEGEFTSPKKQEEPANQVDHSIPQTELELKIIATLEQYIRPAVEQDGGMIVFKSFKDGIVSLLMRGACSGCPSSTVTLKAGIAAILKKFVPEVTDVVSEG